MYRIIFIANTILLCIYGCQNLISRGSRVIKFAYLQHGVDFCYDVMWYSDLVLGQLGGYVLLRLSNHHQDRSRRERERGREGERERERERDSVHLTTKQCAFLFFQGEGEGDLTHRDISDNNISEVWMVHVNEAPWQYHQLRATAYIQRVLKPYTHWLLPISFSLSLSLCVCVCVFVHLPKEGRLSQLASCLHHTDPQCILGELALCVCVCTCVHVYVSESIIVLHVYTCTCTCTCE